MRVADKLAESLPLRAVRLPTPPMRMQVQLVWHPRTHEDPGAIGFRSLIVDALARRALASR